MPAKLATGYAPLSFLLWMKSVDFFLTGFPDKPHDVPRWVLLRFDGKGDKAESQGRIKQPLPATFLGRLAYTVDLLCSIRGASFFRGYAFDFAPARVYSYRSGGFMPWVRVRLRRTFIDLVLTLVTETIICRYPFDITHPYPLTRLGWLDQLKYTALIGVFMHSMMWVSFNTLWLILVPTLRLDPDAYAPMNGNPLKASSLSDFWSNQWHQFCRRHFYRLQLPIEKAAKPYVSKPTLRFIRALGVFGVSTFWHLAVPMGSRDTGTYIVFPEWSVIWFFMSQPFGLLIEVAVVNPATEKLPGRWKARLRKAFFWSWIFWTGRWYCDSFLVYGLLEEPMYSKMIQPLFRNLGI